MQWRLRSRTPHVLIIAVSPALMLADLRPRNSNALNIFSMGGKENVIVCMGGRVADFAVLLKADWENLLRTSWAA